MRARLFVAIAAAFTFISCNTTTTVVTTSGRISPTYQGPSETTYCSPITYSSGYVTISGTATYNARQIYTAGIGGLGSADPLHSTRPAVNKPIRYAEIRITDSSGNLVQCSETLVNGTFSFRVPQTSGTYTVSVNSRGDNNKIKASVLNSPEFNAYYSITKSFTGSATANIGTLTAAADEDTLGGAFNIFDQFVETNDYLRTQAATCHSSYSGCTNFTVAPKVSAYWTKGFNPGSYYNSGPVSFYVRGYSRIFILGGVNGNVNTSDTDHFDNSVIIHEYGHYLEDAYFTSSSPGGSHNGNKIIDPRLALSEGWGNFLQAAVRNDPTYQDSSGNIDGSTTLSFNVNLETADRDISSTNPWAGEGNFREFSISRLFWDAIDNASDIANSATDNLSNGFTQIWAALTKNTNGLNNPNMAFHNVGHVHLGQIWLQNNASGSDWGPLRTMEQHEGSTRDYAQYVTTGSCSDYSLTPANVSGDTGSFGTSDLFRNNKFYHLKISSQTAVTLQLRYQDADLSGTLADLDLYLYNSTARYGTSTDIVASSYNDAGLVTNMQTETISTTLSAGNYLINVMVYTGNSIGGSVTYQLLLNGNTLCPTTLP